MDGDFTFEVWLLRLPIVLGWLTLVWLTGFLWNDPDFREEAHKNESDGCGYENWRRHSAEPDVLVQERGTGTSYCTLLSDYRSGYLIGSRGIPPDEQQVDAAGVRDAWTAG